MAGPTRRSALSAPSLRRPTLPRLSLPQPPRLPVTLSVLQVWLGTFALGIVLLGLGSVMPWRVGAVGALFVSLALTAALAFRTGAGLRVYTTLAGVIGLAAIITDITALRTSAAIGMAAVAAVLGVMLTRPATTTLGAIREASVALAAALLGSVAALGFAPTLLIGRFQWAVLALGVAITFWIVYRLGIGLHGLGRRGVVIVLGGALTFAVLLAYASLIRQYGSHGVVGPLQHGLEWMRAHAAGYPRPIEALLGIPALVFGTHMRSRRAQGWWVTAYGIAATAPVASTLANPDVGLIEAFVSLGYSLLVGAVIGAILIRVDLAFSSASKSNGRRSSGRRAAVVQFERPGVRTEPARTQPLL